MSWGKPFIPQPYHYEHLIFMTLCSEYKYDKLPAAPADFVG
jgi:hypothetical protein